MNNHTKHLKSERGIALIVVLLLMMVWLSVKRQSRLGLDDYMGSARWWCSAFLIW